MRARRSIGRARRSIRAAIGLLAIVGAIGIVPPVVDASSTTYISTSGPAGKAVFNADGSTAFVAVSARGVAAIDTATRAVRGFVDVGSASDLAFDSVNDRVLVATGGPEIDTIDASSQTVGAPIPVNLANGHVFHLGVSSAMQRAVVVVAVITPGPPQRTTYRLASVDLTGATPLVTRTIPAQPEQLVIDDASGLVFTAQGDGVGAYDAVTLAPAATSPIAVDSGSIDLALDQVHHRLYSLSSWDGIPAAVIDTSTQSIVGSLPGIGWGFGIAVDPVAERVFVERNGRLEVFTGGAETAVLPISIQPRHVAVDPSTGNAWVSEDLAKGGVWVVDMDPAARPLSGFVTRSGGDLFVDGQPWTFTGVNLYNANSDGWCRDALDDDTLDAVFDEAVVSHSGHGVVRAWFFQSLATSFPSGQRDWTRFDRLIRLAAIHGTKVIPTLSDQWGECGAKVPPTYAFKTEDWYTSGYKAPDPALATGYGGGWVSYRDWVAEVVARYKDDPTVAFWQLMNEAEVNPGGAFGACPPGDGPRDTLKAFASDVSSLVKGIDPEHLVSLGTIGGGQCGTSGPQYQDVYSLPDLDLCEYHDYTPNQSIPGDQWNGLGVRIQQCAALDKPLFVGELGVRPIDAGGTLLDRARTIRAKVVAQVRRGIDGVVVWDYSPSGPTLDNYDLGPYDAALEFGTNPENATAPYVVTTTDDLDDGSCDAVHCSLREAIAAAQAGGTLPIVQFAIPGSGPHVIRPTSALPTITRALLLDGTSQTDFAGSPTVVISGVDAPAGDGLVIQHDDAAVRGLVINGFTGADIRLLGAGSSLITGNRIGTDVSGTVAVRNPSGQAAAGIVIEGSAGNQVGGVTGGDPNLIAGVDAGVLVTGSGATGNRIVGNLIGTDSAGSPGAGITGSGVRIANGASGNVVGGAGSGERNAISGATGDAVAIVDDATAGNTISGNAIDGNGGLGIDLGDDGVDPPAGISNPTTGPNRHQARPLIDDVTAGVITGRVWGISGSIHVEFFASSACDPSGSGEGARFIGATDVTTTGLPPSATFSFVPSPAVGPTDVITATATTSAGTSEFSPCWPSATGGDTPAGSDVVTQPIDPATGQTPVLIGFETVTTGGVTSLTTSGTGPAAPAGFALGDPPTYFDISTTAGYSGDIVVCISYAGVAYIDPTTLRLLHFDSGAAAWVDATTSVDTSAQQVCGAVTSLSPFVLVQPKPSFASAASATFKVGSSGSFAVRTTGFAHPALTAIGTLPAGLTFVDRGDGTASLGGMPSTGTGRTYAITLRGSEAGVVVDQPFTLTVREAPGFTSPATAAATIGVPLSFQVTTRGYPTPTLTRTGSLPAGLTFNAGTGSCPVRLALRRAEPTRSPSRPPMAWGRRRSRPSRSPLRSARPRWSRRVPQGRRHRARLRPARRRSRTPAPAPSRHPRVRHPGAS